MRRSLASYYPSDDAFRDDAIANVATRLVAEDEIAGMIVDLADDPISLAARIDRLVTAEIAELRRRDSELLTDEDSPT